MTQAYPPSPALPKLSNITWALKLKGAFQIYICCRWFFFPGGEGRVLWIRGLLVRYSTQYLLSTYWVLWPSSGWDREISFVLKITQCFYRQRWEKGVLHGRKTVFKTWKNKGYIQGIAIILIWLEYWLGNKEYWEIPWIPCNFDIWVISNSWYLPTHLFILT